MQNPLFALKDRILDRLIARPETLDMAEFSRVSAYLVTTFCLAGLILDESGVRLKYSDAGVAVGLADGERKPSQQWVAYEISLSGAPNVDRAFIVMAARARELWAAAYGERAARLLPFYARDWEVDPSQLRTIRPEKVISLLQAINVVAAATSNAVAA